MRVDNIHEPQAGHTEGQTQTLRRRCDPITPLRIRNVADDEDDHTDEKKNSSRSRSRRRRTPRPRQRTIR